MLSLLPQKHFDLDQRPMHGSLVSKWLLANWLCAISQLVCEIVGMFGSREENALLSLFRDDVIGFCFLNVFFKKGTFITNKWVSLQIDNKGMKRRWE